MLKGQEDIVLVGVGGHCSWLFRSFPGVLKLSSPAKAQTAPCLPRTSSMPCHIGISPYHSKSRQILHALSQCSGPAWSWCFKEEGTLFDLIPHWHSHAYQNITQLWFDFANKISMDLITLSLRKKKNKVSNVCCGTKLELNIKFF